jgi:hypothetical protein
MDQLVLVHELKSLEGGKENAGELRGRWLLMLTRLHQPIVEGESTVGHAQGRDGGLKHGVHGVALLGAGFWLGVYHVGRFDVAVVGGIDKVSLVWLMSLDICHSVCISCSSLKTLETVLDVGD